MQGKQRYKGQVCVALPSQLWPVMTAVVCYKGQALLQLFPHINQQKAGQWIMFSVNQVLFTHTNTVSSSETSGLPLCVKSLAGLCHIPPSLAGHILQPNPPHTHRHTLQFRARVMYKNRLWKQAPVIMRRELEEGRKRPSPSGSTGSRRLRSGSCLSCEISIYIVARTLKSGHAKAWPSEVSCGRSEARLTDSFTFIDCCRQSLTGREHMALSWPLFFCPQAVQAQNNSAVLCLLVSGCQNVSRLTSRCSWNLETSCAKWLIHGCCFFSGNLTTALFPS